MDSSDDRIKIPIFNIENLENELDIIKILCIEKTFSKYEISFDDISKIVLAYNNIKMSIKSLEIIQNTLIELNKKSS